MTTQTAAPAGKELATISQLLAENKGHMMKVAPKHFNANKLFEVATIQLQQNPDLLECTPVSLVGAILQASMLGLMLDTKTRSAYLVPFNNEKKGVKEVQLIIGYGGLQELVSNSGKCKVMPARAVHKNDVFEYEFGTGAFIKHIPYSGPDAGEVTHYYSTAQFNDGTISFDVMTAAEVDRVRQNSPSRNSPAWAGHKTEMGKKTALRRHSKYLPLSREAAVAVTLDEQAALGLPQDLGMLASPTERETKGAIDTTVSRPQRASHTDRPDFKTIFRDGDNGEKVATLRVKDLPAKQGSRPMQIIAEDLQEFNTYKPAFIQLARELQAEDKLLDIIYTPNKNPKYGNDIVEVRQSGFQEKPAEAAAPAAEAGKETPKEQAPADDKKKDDKPEKKGGKKDKPKEEGELPMD